MTTTAATTTVNPPTTPDTIGNPLVAELDTLIRQLDGSVKFTRDTARDIGGILTRIKSELFAGNVGRFNVWFVGRYHRTAQSAAQWIRLATVWDDCRTAYDADQTPDKEPWDRLSIIDTLALVATARKPKATDKPKDKTAPETTTTLPAADEINKAIKTFASTGKTVYVKVGSKIKVGKEWITFEGPLMLVPEGD